MGVRFTYAARHSVRQMQPGRIQLQLAVVQYLRSTGTSLSPTYKELNVAVGSRDSCPGNPTGRDSKLKPCTVLVRIQGGVLDKNDCLRTRIGLGA